MNFQFSITDLIKELSGWLLLAATIGGLIWLLVDYSLPAMGY